MYELKTQLEGDTLTVFVGGRINSKVAPDFEREVMDALAQAPGANIVLDAENLEYTSSAGLRVFMKMRKSAAKEFKMINVSPEVYDVLDLTGFTMLLNVQQK